MALKNRSMYAILGILNISPGTGYDIKKYCDKLLTHFCVILLAQPLNLSAFSLNESNSAWRTGDTITVYYDPNDPATVTTGIIGWLLSVQKSRKCALPICYFLCRACPFR